MITDQMPSHRDFYTTQLVQAFEFYLEERSPELAWMLVEALGLARLFGVKMPDVLDHLRKSPELMSSPDKLDVVEDILEAEDRPTSNLAGLNYLIQQAFEDDSSLGLNDLIADYLENLEYKIIDEWEEKDDEIVIYHTSTVAAYQWLSEKILGNEELLPIFIHELDKLGTMLSSITETIRLQIHDFLAGQPVAQFMYEGTAKDYLTQNFIFLSDEFLSIKNPDFVLPLSQELEILDRLVGLSQDLVERVKKFFRPEGFQLPIPSFALGPLGTPEQDRKEEPPPELHGNLLVIDIDMPHEGGWVYLLLPQHEIKSDESDKLERALKHLRKSGKYWQAGIIFGADQPQTWKPDSLPRTPEPITQHVPKQTAAILIGLCSDEKLLEKAIALVCEGKECTEESILWILYRPAAKRAEPQ